MQETWKPIVGYEGWYDISDLGRVKRVKRGHHTRPGLILKPSQTRKIWSAARHKFAIRYSFVNLYHGTKDSVRKKRIHNAVAEAFLGPTPTGKQIHHKDGKPANNRLDNLEHVTLSEHYNDRHDALRGEENGNSKLTIADVRRVMASSEPANHLATKLGVSQGAILAIRWGLTWRHVTHLPPPQPAAKS